MDDCFMLYDVLVRSWTCSQQNAGRSGCTARACEPRHSRRLFPSNAQLPVSAMKCGLRLLAAETLLRTNEPRREGSCLLSQKSKTQSVAFHGDNTLHSEVSVMVNDNHTTLRTLRQT